MSKKVRGKEEKALIYFLWTVKLQDELKHRWLIGRV